MTSYTRHSLLFQAWPRDRGPSKSALSSNPMSVPTFCISASTPVRPLCRLSWVRSIWWSRLPWLWPSFCWCWSSSSWQCTATERRPHWRTPPCGTRARGACICWMSLRTITAKLIQLTEVSNPVCILFHLHSSFLINQNWVPKFSPLLQWHFKLFPCLVLRYLNFLGQRLCAVF